MSHSHAHAVPGPFAGQRHRHPRSTSRAWRELRRAARLAKMTGGHRSGHRGGPGAHRGPDVGFGPGFGGPGFGPGFGGPGFGGPGGPRWFRHGGRRKRRGDVRSALLLLLAEEPRNGYGLMQEIEQRSDGDWRPSPGSVYPALSQLEDEGLVRGDAAEGGAGRTYSLTDAGRAEVEARDPSRPAPWETPADERGDSVQQLRPVVGQLIAATFQVAQAGSEAQVTRARDVLAEARRALYRILAEDQEDAGGDAPSGDAPAA